MNFFTFDWTVRVDSVLMALSMIGTGGAVWGTVRADLRSLGEKVRQVEASIAQQTDILISMARQDEHLRSIDRRLEALEK